MAEAFLMPGLGEGVVEAEVIRWHVAEGDAVAEDEEVVEVNTDKVCMDLPSPFAGTVLKLAVPEGATVRVGQALLYVGDPHETSPHETSPHETSPHETSPHETLLHETPPHETPRADGVATAAELVRDGVLATRDERRRVPLRGIRRTVAQNVMRAHREVPAVTIAEECDFSDLRRLHLSYLPHVLMSTARALRQHPEFNAFVDGEELVLNDRIDIGIATHTDDGLLVPVLRAADRLDLAALGAEVRRLHDAARRGELCPAELRDSTFTVSAAGRRGGFLATPLVHHPEVAILAVHRIVPRPVVRGGEVVVRRIGMVSLTFDHRVADGIVATDFLLDVIARLGDLAGGSS
jgi:pyruvate dehydrogenase E2 component (dihydrolipoyllysine-residue acetyltransferase)